MAKWANDVVLDAFLSRIAEGNELLVTDGQPTDRADALSKSLASDELTSGDFSITDIAGGRQLSISQLANIPVTKTGQANHVCILDSGNLLFVTTVTAQTLTNGNTVTVPGWTVAVTDPS